MPQKQKHWFAARTRDKQEFSVRDSLEKIGVDYFLPTHFVLRELKYRKKRVEVPVIRNLIFIHADKELACALHNQYGIPVFYMKCLSTRTMLVVPDSQMRDFIRIMSLDSTDVTLTDDSLVAGARVQVIDGKFCGIEGELLSTSNRSYVVVRLDGVLTAKVKVLKRELRVKG